jgi:hypothetical protein
MLCCVALGRTDISVERNTSIIRVTRFGELGTMLAVTSNRHTLVTANVVPSSWILVTLMMEALHYLKCRFLQEPHSITSQKRAFFKDLYIHSSICFHGAVLNYLRKKKILPFLHLHFSRSCTVITEKPYFIGKSNVYMKLKSSTEVALVSIPQSVYKILSYFWCSIGWGRKIMENYHT